MMPLERFDAIVVGAGLMGASAALHLRVEHGLTVALLERGLVGAQASGVNFGHVRRQGRYLPQLPLAHRSREIWGRLAELVGEDCEFLPSGSLKLGLDDAEMGKLLRYAEDARDWGLELTILSAGQVRSRFPYLGPEVLGGTLQADDGHANPRLVAPAFGRAARRAGVDVREHCEVTSIEHDGAGFRVCCADGRELAAASLINAAGAWGNRIAAHFGEQVPMTVMGPQMAVTEPLPYFLPPAIGNGSGSTYLRQVARGNVVWGGGRRGAPQVDPPRARPIPEHLPAQWPGVLRLIPALRGVQVIRTWSGIEGYIGDGLPIMGPSATRPGLFHLFGFCGHGFQLGPGAGAVAAEYVANGGSPTPIEDFAISRFSVGNAAVTIKADDGD